MKQIPFFVDNQIIYVDHQTTTNKNAYLKVTRTNKLLITAPTTISVAQIVATFTPRIKAFLRFTTLTSNNVLYSLAKQYVFFQGRRLPIIFLTGYLQSRVKVTPIAYYLMTKTGSNAECEATLKKHLSEWLQSWIAKRQPF